MRQVAQYMVYSQWCSCHCFTPVQIGWMKTLLFYNNCVTTMYTDDVWTNKKSHPRDISCHPVCPHSGTICHTWTYLKGSYTTPVILPMSSLQVNLSSDCLCTNLSQWIFNHGYSLFHIHVTAPWWLLHLPHIIAAPVLCGCSTCVGVPICHPWVVDELALLSASSSSNC